jgi:putative sterol carrier protein
MADATTEFFGELVARGHEPLLKEASGTLRFDLRDGKRVDRWLVAVEKGDVAVTRRNVGADCVVSTDRALFDAIASGKTNALAALLRGAVGVEGDIQLLVLFQRLFPGPPRARKRRRSAATAKRNP